MNIFSLGMVALLTTVLVTGCGKKEDTADMSFESNAVISDNVVSLTDSAAQTTDQIPVIIENAETAVDATLATAVAATATAEAVVTDKPTPKNIQTALKNAGLYAGKIDGSIGPKTKRAIEAFQSQNGLKVDGKVGPKTWKALSVYLNRTTEVVNPSAVEQTIGQ